MNNATTIYGRDAYAGFARAIGSKLGLNVQIDDGASACIDAGGIIRLPGMSTYQTAAQFAITCGTLIHELAHQFYRTHEQIDPKRPQLLHDCFNAVVDVADETWVADWFARRNNARPGELLQQGNAHAAVNNYNAYTDWTDPTRFAWNVLCSGILYARSHKAGRAYRRYANWLKKQTIRHAARHGVDVRPCFRLLARARLTVKESSEPTAKRFRKLGRLAGKLADILAPFAPPAGAAAPAGIAAPGSKLAGALADGQSSAPANATPATAGDGEALVDSPAKGAGGPTGAGSSGGQPFDSAAHAMLFPAVSRIAERIATDGDGITREGGLTSGPMIGQAYRLLTDGACLSRWSDNSNADGLSVAVLLDRSSSMNRNIAAAAGVARSFAQAMRTAGDVQSYTFSNDVEPSDDFATVRAYGCTATDRALRTATDWLSTRTGRRFIVLVTDGEPDSQSATDAAYRTATAAGIGIVVVGLACTLSAPFPVRCVSAATPAHLAIELDAAAREIEAAA